MKTIAALRSYSLLASMMFVLQGCVSVRHDRLVRADDGLRSESAEIYVVVSGKREKLRNNPFVVWTRETAPYNMSIYVYVFDPKYDGMSVSSVNVWVDDREITSLKSEYSVAHTVGGITAFEKYCSSSIQERHANAPAYISHRSFTVDEKLPYETDRNIKVGATVVLWSGGEQKESFEVTSRIEPRVDQDSGSWLRCLWLILGGGM